MIGLLTDINLNNRELSIGFWLFAASVFVISRKSQRNSLYKVLVAFLNKSVFFPMIMFILYTSSMAFALSKIGFWEISNVKETAFWFFGVGISMFMNVSNSAEKDFFRELLLRNIKISGFLGIWEFIVNVYVLELWFELMVVPVFFVVGGSLGISSTKSKYKKVRELLNNIIAIAGFGLIADLPPKNWSRSKVRISHSRRQVVWQGKDIQQNRLS